MGRVQLWQLGTRVLLGAPAAQREAAPRFPYWVNWEHSTVMSPNPPTAPSQGLSAPSWARRRGSRQLEGRRPPPPPHRTAPQLARLRRCPPRRRTPAQQVTVPWDALPRALRRGDPGKGPGQGWGWHGAQRPPRGGFAEKRRDGQSLCPGRTVTVPGMDGHCARAARRAPVGSTRDQDPRATPLCPGSSISPQRAPAARAGSSRSRATCRRGGGSFRSGQGRGTAPAGSPVAPRCPPGRDAAEAPAPEIYFNVNLALRQLFLIFKLFHINPWPDICFL